MQLGRGIPGLSMTEAINFQMVDNPYLTGLWKGCPSSTRESAGSDVGATSQIGTSEESARFHFFD
jgi:hypothetical protein